MIIYKKGAKTQTSINYFHKVPEEWQAIHFSEQGQDDLTTS